ncbi:hypothetical protein ACQ4PT_051552 [Festuca glaucescens]
MLSSLALCAGVGDAEMVPPVGLRGCNTSCGDVVVPYPFGIGQANCSLPGYNLTCDTSGRRPPRLLLGALQVSNIDIGDYYAGSSLGLTADIDSIHAFLGGLTEEEPYGLSRGNELILTGCNVQSTLTNGNITVSGCSSVCASVNGSLDIQLSAYQGYIACGSGTGCCHAPIVVGQEKHIASGGAYDLQLKWFSWNRTIDQTWTPRLYIASIGWFDKYALTRGLLQTDRSPSKHAIQVPILLDWEIIGHGTQPANTKNRTCTGGLRGGYRCYCENGYIGNPYLTDGCTGYNFDLLAIMMSAKGKKANRASASVSTPSDRTIAIAQEEPMEIPTCQVDASILTKEQVLVRDT